MRPIRLQKTEKVKGEHCTYRRLGCGATNTHWFAGHYFSLVQHKNKPRVIVYPPHEDDKKHFRTYQVLSPSQARVLIGWLARYIALSDTDPISLAIASTKVHASEIRREQDKDFYGAWIMKTAAEIARELCRAKDMVCLVPLPGKGGISSHEKTLCDCEVEKMLTQALLDAETRSKKHLSDEELEKTIEAAYARTRPFELNPTPKKPSMAQWCSGFMEGYRACEKRLLGGE